MKENEIRIGNWVYSKEFNEQRIVGLIGNGHILAYAIDKGGLDGTKGIIDAEPIPLTEEWLLKFGMKYEKEEQEYFTQHFYKLHDNFYMKIEQCKKDMSFDDCFTAYFDGYCLISVKTVHQLQNLFFALTGEELTLK